MEIPQSISFVKTDIGTPEGIEKLFGHLVFAAQMAKPGEMNQLGYRIALAISDWKQRAHNGIVTKDRLAVYCEVINEFEEAKELPIAGVSRIRHEIIGELNDHPAALIE